jgi:hypothetical protein
VEHRWGQRVEIDIPVCLRMRGGRTHRAVLRDLSASGAFVRTITPPAPFTSVTVEFDESARGACGMEARAFVVRDEAEGVALEWAEFNPPPVAALLSAPVAVEWGSARSDAA